MNVPPGFTAQIDILANETLSIILFEESMVFVTMDGMDQEIVFVKRII
jgi:hypothetical protein